MNTSSGRSSALATSYATGTPPRGSASTRTSGRPAYLRRCAASACPACTRSRNGRDNACVMSRLRQVSCEPLARVIDDFFERAGLLEQVSRAWNDDQLCGSRKLRLCLAVEVDHDFIALADDQQRRRVDPF